MTDTNNNEASKVAHINWNTYFMGTAILSAMRSKDPDCQVGACIVNKKDRIVGLGYNGMPNKCKDEDYDWNSDKKHFSVCHAEMNAIVNKNSGEIEGSTLFCLRIPCSECTKIIIQSGIQQIIYTFHKRWSDETMPEKRETKKNDYQLTIRMMAASNIKLIPRPTQDDYDPDNEHILPSLPPVSDNEMEQFRQMKRDLEVLCPYFDLNKCKRRHDQYTFHLATQSFATASRELNGFH